MIRARTPGGHPLVVIVLFDGEATVERITHVVACEGCGAQYNIKCARPLLVEVMDGVHPDQMREHLTAKAMMAREQPVDEHLYDHVWTMIEFYDERPCVSDGEVWRSEDAPCDDSAVGDTPAVDLARTLDT
jgi:hypothetical protein